MTRGAWLAWSISLCPAHARHLCLPGFLGEWYVDRRFSRTGLGGRCRIRSGRGAGAVGGLRPGHRDRRPRSGFGGGFARFVASPCVLLPGHWIHPSTPAWRLQVTLPELPNGGCHFAQTGLDSPRERGTITQIARVRFVRHDAIVSQAVRASWLSGVSRLTRGALLRVAGWQGASDCECRRRGAYRRTLQGSSCVATHECVCRPISARGEVRWSERDHSPRNLGEPPGARRNPTLQTRSVIGSIHSTVA